MSFMEAYPRETPEQGNPFSQGDLQRKDIAYKVTLVASIAMGLATMPLVISTLSQQSWQKYCLSTLAMIAFLLSVISLSRRISTVTTRINLVLFAVLLLAAGISILVEGQAAITAIVALAIVIIITSITIASDASQKSLMLGMAGSWLIALAGLMIPVEKVALPAASTILSTVLAILAMAYATLLVMEYVSATLQIRLILGGMVILVVPLMLVTFLQSLMAQNSISARLQEALLSSSAQAANHVDEFFSSNIESITRESRLPTIFQYLNAPPEERTSGKQLEDLQFTFQALQKQAVPYLISYGILSSKGDCLFDMNTPEIGLSEANSTYFTEAIRGRIFVSDIEFSDQDRRPYLYFSVPIYGEYNQVIGILRAKYSAQVFQDLLEQDQKLVGANSFPILVDEFLLRIADTLKPNILFQTLTPLSQSQVTTLLSSHRILAYEEDAKKPNHLLEIAAFIKGGAQNNFTTADFSADDSPDPQPKFVAITHLKYKDWALMYTQSTSDLTELAANQEKSTTFIAVILAGIVAIATTYLSRQLTDPITKLTAAAGKITSGDLSVNIPISNDEVGTLANAFNVMTNRLRQFFSELENRVQARTHELAERNEPLTIRSRQIQTISEVARNIASTQELDALMNDVAEMVSERFGFYHVGIFLLDDHGDYAVLKAANSQGGKQMLARHHQLKVGQVGIVGYVASNGRPRVATDVGNDAIYFNNPDLPLTRSEMALPLVGRGKVIGVFDVQSTQPEAFGEQDIELFSTLADQIAVAILNSRAFEETKLALEEARLIHKQYLEQAWTQETSEHLHYSFEYTPQGVIARERVTSPDINEVFKTGQSIIKDAAHQAGDNSHYQNATMGVPIVLRGETIGIIHIQDQGSNERVWAEDEIHTVRAIADQVSQALENARLFEQTVRRAERERKVLEITSKIRSTTSPEEMLQIAVNELHNALHATRTQVIFNKIQPSDDFTGQQSHSRPGQIPKNGNGH